MFFYLAYKLAGQPQDIWQNPTTIALFTIVVGAAVAIAVGVYQVRQGRTRRKLVYETLSNASIVSVNSAVADQVEIDIRVKGTLLKDAHLLVVNIKNAGKVSIHASDYFEPLTFEFDAKVLQASVLETTPSTLINPSTLPTFLTLTPQSVQFPAFPLNPGDTVQMSILLEGKGTLKVRGRLDQGTVVALKPEMKGFVYLLIGLAALILGMTGNVTTTALGGLAALALALVTALSAVVLVTALVIFAARRWTTK